MQKFSIGDRVRPSGEYEAQFRSKRTLGTVIVSLDADMCVVKWDEKGTETLHADFLLLAGEFVIVDAHGWQFPHAGRSRAEAIAIHVSTLWSGYLDEFPELPPTLEFGRLSLTQQRAWDKSEALGHRVHRAVGRTRNALGRKPREWLDAQKQVIWNEWHSKSNETNADAAAAASRQLKISVAPFQMYHVVRDMRRAAGDANATGASGRLFRKRSK